jgi:hypothetical protein
MTNLHFMAKGRLKVDDSHLAQVGDGGELPRFKSNQVFVLFFLGSFKRFFSLLLF